MKNTEGNRIIQTNTKLNCIFYCLWSTWWPISKYEIQFKVYSHFSIALVFGCLSYAYIFNKFYAFNSISFTVSNLLFISISMALLVSVVESIYQKEAQMKLIRNVLLADHLFNGKLKVMIPYYKEKCEIFTRFIVLVKN